MGFLTGNRSKFPNDVDQIKELYDLPPSLREDASRYQELVSKTNLSTEESQELERLTTKLSDYIITAEDRNYFGDIVIKIQKFFKENVQDFISQKQTEFNQAIQQKKDEVIQTVNTLTNLVEQKKEEITNFVTTSKEQANTYKDTKNQEIQIEIDKFKDFGLWTQTKQYHSKNIVHYEGNAFIAKKDNINTTPVITSNDTWELLTIKGDVGYSVNLQPKGTFSVSSNYIINDLVNYKGNLFYCKKNCNGIFPTDESYWNLFLSGNGEILTDLQTDNKLSLVGAINENKIKIDSNSFAINSMYSNEQIDGLLNNKANKEHNHDNKYYQKDEINTKLQEVENNLSSAVLLNKIKTVDGVDSGLDADLLDGKDSSAFALVEHNHNTQYLGVNDKAKDTDLFDGKNSNDFVRQLLKFDGNTTDSLTLEIVKNSAYLQSYIGDIDFGTQIGLPVNYSHILYIPHRSQGYGVQIAIPFENGKFTSMYVRNSMGTIWNKWQDMLSSGNAEANDYRYLRDANSSSIESGKLYYCSYNQCQNLPTGLADDGILVAYYHRNDSDGIWGYQTFMSWNQNSIWMRNVIQSRYQTWKCIYGGDWNSPINRDSNQVGNYLRWKHYGQNHVIFDASNGTTPTGRACDRINPEVGWQANCPTLMGWNGANTHGVRVSNAGWADGAHNANNVQGFQFRNNNGQLEVLVQGQWLKVGGGGVQYTVVRQGTVGTYNDFTYSGGAGILRILITRDSSFNSLPNSIIIDGTEIDRDIAKSYNNGAYFTIENIEFKNSITLTRCQRSSYKYLIQTEK